MGKSEGQRLLGRPRRGTYYGNCNTK